MQDIYHSVYLLRRTPGTPFCGEQERRRVIHDILASLTVWLQRWAQPTTTKEWARMGQEGSYEVALWAAHHRALKTAKALCSDSKVGEEDHAPIPKVRAGVGLGPSLGLTLGLSPGPTLEVNLGIGQRPMAKAATMVIPKVYVLGPLRDPLLKGE